MAVKQSEDIFSEPLETQLTELVFSPFAQSAHTLPGRNLARLLIIDDLQKCFDPVLQANLLVNLFKALRCINNQYWPKVLIVSRPEQYLLDTFNGLPESVVHRLSSDLEGENIGSINQHGKAVPQVTGRLFNIQGKGFARLKFWYAPRAAHYARHRNKPECHMKTRIAISTKLMNLVSDNLVGVDSTIIWLNGAPGVGKSAIAQRLAERCSQEDLLLASFFFSQTDMTRNSSKSLAATIAYQVGFTILGTREHISAAVERNNRIFLEPLDTQLTEMVFRPLTQALDRVASTATRLPSVIIIDGLNECLDNGVQCQILEGFSNALLRAKHLNLKIIFLSRPERHLEAIFNSKNLASVVYQLVLAGLFAPVNDIRIFLEDKLADIKTNHPARSLIPSTWPTPTIVDEILRRSNGAFIYASNIAAYIGRPDVYPATRLDEILSACVPESPTMPLAHLDALYSKIISSIPYNSGLFKMIVGVILFIDTEYNLFSPLTATQFPTTQTLSGIESLLSLEWGTAKTLIANLYPMFHSTQLGNILVSHVTVAEFFDDPLRSKEYYIDKKDIISTLLRHCYENIRNRSNSSTLYFAYSCILQLSLSLQSTPELRRELTEFNLSQCYLWCKENSSEIGEALDRQSLFPWWYVTKFMTVLRQLEDAAAYTHHLLVFDQLVLSSLEKYPSVEDVQLLLSLLSIPLTCLNITRKRAVNLIHRLLWKASTLKVDRSSSGLGLFSLYDGGNLSDKKCFRVGRHLDQDIVLDVYYEFLFEFFADPSRAGVYCLRGEGYASAAYKCLKFVLESPPEVFVESDDTRDAKRLANAFIPHLLRRASESKPLLKLTRHMGLGTEALLSNEDSLEVNQAMREYRKKHAFWSLLF